MFHPEMNSWTSTGMSNKEKCIKMGAQLPSMVEITMDQVIRAQKLQVNESKFA